MQNIDRKKNIDEIKKVSVVGLIANIMLSALKIVAGIIGNSQAVVADGIHSISDSVTDVAVIIGATYWSAPPDDDHPHGHGRIETAVTVFIGFVLVAIAGGLGWNAVANLFEKRTEPIGEIAFYAAIISIVVKEILYRWNISVGKRLKCKALIANAWHHRSDALSSVPAAIAVIVVKIYPDAGYIDKIGAVIVCGFIFYTAFKIVWPALRELTDAGVSESERLNIENTAKEVPGVQDVHKCRTRFVGSGVQVDLHVLVDPGMSVRDGHDVSSNVKNTLIEKCPDIVDVIVHLEPDE